MSQTLCTENSGSFLETEFMRKKDNKNNANPKKSRSAFILYMIALSMILIWSIFTIHSCNSETSPVITDVSFTEFQALAKEGKIKKVEIGLGYSEDFTFEDVDGKLYTSPNPKSSNFKRELLEYNIEVVELSETSWLSIVLMLLQYILLPVILIVMLKRMMPKTDKDELVKEVPNVTFDDVAGVSELKNDLKYVIDYLKDPSHYDKLGAKMPKGIILYGPPGTGKTLMAKAIAGTAGVPFFSASGSDFIEMYVGLGAKRVRNLFKKAREAAPCIIFIDEIDAVGASRNSAASHSENNQTINALLNELDGFNGSEGILIVAATNRLEDLDPALIRPGRFDKQLAVPLPEKKDRLDMLKVHSRNKKFDDSIDWDEIAATTVGFSGAAIASMLNEAAFIAASQKRQAIVQDDIDRAIYKILMKGDQKEDQSARSKEELAVCAYHEAGHAIATRLYTNDRIPKVTIVSSTSGAGGVTFRTPQEKGLVSKKYIEGCIKLMYAGRAAEEIYFNDKDMITTGASSDIKQATALIKDYIGVYGMSDDYGLINISAFNNINQKDLIEKSAEIAKVQYSAVKCDLEKNRKLLDLFAKLLIEKESLHEQEIEELFKQHPPM